MVDIKSFLFKSILSMSSAIVQQAKSLIVVEMYVASGKNYKK